MSHIKFALYTEGYLLWINQQIGLFLSQQRVGRKTTFEQPSAGAGAVFCLKLRMNTASSIRCILYQYDYHNLRFLMHSQDTIKLGQEGAKVKDKEVYLRCGDGHKEATCSCTPRNNQQSILHLWCGCTMFWHDKDRTINTHTHAPYLKIPTYDCTDHGWRWLRWRLYTGVTTTFNEVILLLLLDRQWHGQVQI